MIGNEITPQPELITLSELTTRCGHFSDGDLNNGYCCSHPENDAEPGCCFGWACPVGFEADYEDIQELSSQLAEELAEDYAATGSIQGLGAIWMVVPKNKKNELEEN